MLKCRSLNFKGVESDFFGISSKFVEIQKSGFTSGKRKQKFVSPLLTDLVVVRCQRRLKICFSQTLQLITDFIKFSVSD